MINRYLGNKTDLLLPMMETITAHAKPGDLVCDIFSGTLAVSLELKRHGYRVASNDINLFSHVYGVAYLTNSTIPDICFDSMLRKKDIAGLARRADTWLQQLRNEPGFCFLQSPDLADRYHKLLVVLLHLQECTSESLPAAFQRNDIFATYTEEGPRSGYRSKRGQEGRRRFFSASNGRRIDTILNKLRLWRQRHLTSPVLHAMLSCILLEATEKVSNTQGTYHDFPRAEYDPRARNPLTLRPPPLDGIVGKRSDHVLGNEEDSLDFIRRVPRHSMLYIDPPYNFRQYTSYYFMLNLLCRYCDISDLDQYFAEVQFVRGQNMGDDFVSVFCKKSQFISALQELIGRANTRYVLLSYFNGRNHWNDFNSDCNGIADIKIKDLFASPLFLAGSFRATPVARLNYQSYGGYRAREVSEHLFLAEKVKAEISVVAAPTASRCVAR